MKILSVNYDCNYTNFLQKNSCSCKQVECSLWSFLEAGSGDTGILALPAQVAGDGLKLLDVHGAVIVGVKHLKNHPYILQSTIMVLSRSLAYSVQTFPHSSLHCAEQTHGAIIVGIKYVGIKYFGIKYFKYHTFD